MKQWDKERIIKKEAMREDAIDFISFSLENNISKEKIIDHLTSRYRFSPATIDELFEKANAAVMK